MTQCKTPLVPAGLMAGYMELKAQQDFMESTEKMLSCIRLMIKQINKEKGAMVMTVLDVAEAEASAHAARAAVTLMGAQHRKVMKKLSKLGYSQPSDEELAELGPVGREG